MLSMTRLMPWTELAGLHRDLDTMFTRAFGEGTNKDSSELSTNSFIPAADVRREGDRWLVSLALAGVSPEKVSIDVVGRTLRVRGERITDSKTDVFVREIPDGQFEREFTLPEEIDAKHVQATYRHGLLEAGTSLERRREAT